MKQFFAILKKELLSYATSLSTYIVAAVFLAVANFFFFRTFFIAGQASMNNFFSLLPWLFLFLLPAISMRLWSEESKQGTSELLATWPIKSWQPVLAKIAAAWVLLLVIMAMTLTVPLTISQLGSQDIGVIITSYLAAALLAAAALSVGALISSLTNNQIVAFILTIAALTMLYLIGETTVSSLFPSFFAKTLTYLSLTQHYGSMLRGVFDTRDLLYYISIVIIFSILNLLRIQKRK